MPVVESRYAEALLSMVPSAEIADKVEAVLSDFSSMLSNHEEMRFFLLNPVVSKEIKKETIQKLLSDDADSHLLHFMFLLVDQERLAVLPEISREYTQVKNVWQNNLKVVVYSAEALDEDQLLIIGEKYKKQYGAMTANVYNEVDASLLGGVRIKIGDTYIDDTLLGRLKSLLNVL